MLSTGGGPGAVYSPAERAQTPVLRAYLRLLFIENNQPEKAKTELNRIAQIKNLTTTEILQVAKIALEATWFKEANFLFNGKRR